MVRLNPCRQITLKRAAVELQWGNARHSGETTGNAALAAPEDPRKLSELTVIASTCKGMIARLAPSAIAGLAVLNQGEAFVR